MTTDQRKCIALIGPRGCGKTTVGRILANLLGGECVDMDEWIAQRAGRSIAEIFANEGEDGFRMREAQAVREIMARCAFENPLTLPSDPPSSVGSSDPPAGERGLGSQFKLPVVISVGGGAVIQQENVDLLRTIAVLVWLTAPAEVLWQRITADPASASLRPPLTDQSGIEEVRRLLNERSPLYQRASDFQIETVDREPRIIAEEIVRRVRPSGVMDGRTNAQGRRC